MLGAVGSALAEAPEYVFIDEDFERPRFAGTGLEDYFLGGWYFRERHINSFVKT